MSLTLWLVEDGPGWAIVDTGVGLADVRALWEGIFAGHLGGRPVTRVIVTHFHPDHMGNAAWLTERFDVDLWCAQAEYLLRAKEVARNQPAPAVQARIEEAKPRFLRTDPRGARHLTTGATAAERRRWPGSGSAATTIRGWCPRCRPRSGKSATATGSRSAAGASR